LEVENFLFNIPPLQDLHPPHPTNTMEHMFNSLNREPNKQDVAWHPTPMVWKLRRHLTHPNPSLHARPPCATTLPMDPAHWRLLYHLLKHTSQVILRRMIDRTIPATDLLLPILYHLQRHQLRHL
jgi:hypothetical protein